MRKFINIALIILIIAVVYKGYFSDSKVVPVEKSNQQIVSNTSIYKLKDEEESLELEEKKLLEKINNTKDNFKSDNKKVEASIKVNSNKPSQVALGSIEEKTQEELEKEELQLLASLNTKALPVLKANKAKSVKPYVEKEVKPQAKEFEDISDLVEVKAKNIEKIEVSKRFKLVRNTSDIERKKAKKPKKIRKTVSRKLAPVINDFRDPDFNSDQISTNLVSLTNEVKDMVRIVKDTAIRVGPGFNYPRINVLTKGDQVKLVKHYERWSKIVDVNGIISWVNNVDIE